MLREYHDLANAGDAVVALQWDGNPLVLREAPADPDYIFYVNAGRDLVALHRYGKTSDIRFGPGSWLVWQQRKPGEYAALECYSNTGFEERFSPAAEPSVHASPVADEQQEALSEPDGPASPSVGRVVRYYPMPGQAAGTGAEPHAALVSRSYPDGRLALTAFPPLRPSYTVVVNEQGAKPGCWTWA
jgi:hypothetical protein